MKAEPEDAMSTLSYFHKKTDELLQNGVEKVIWIFTDSRKVMIAETTASWQILDWSVDIEIIDDLKVNIEKLVDVD